MSIDAVSARYERLDPRLVADTLASMQARIDARFPGRGLGSVADELRRVLRETNEESAVRRRQEQRTRVVCNAAATLVGAAAAIAVGVAVRDAFDAAEGTRAFEWLPVLESGINDVGFAALAVFFLVSVPSRVRRRRALHALHRLRSIAHVIDMHQLTKDPERVLSEIAATDQSPVVDLSPAELGRYLDHCSELLSIVGKAAALVGESSTDPLVLDTVSEIESLTLGMSRKIWQKISLLHRA
jgi:hypothetical protein